MTTENANTGFLTTLDAVLVSRTTETPLHRFLLRPEHNTIDTPAQEVTYGTFDAHVSRLARTWMNAQADGKLERNVIIPRAIVGVFLPSGYTLCTVLFALIRLGAVPFCISPRNSDEALKHLVRTGNVVAIVANTDNSLASRIKMLLQTEAHLHVPVLEVSDKDVSDLPSGTEFHRGSYPSVTSGVLTGKDIVIQQHVRGYLILQDISR